MVDVKIIHPIECPTLIGLGCTEPWVNIGSESRLHLRVGKRDR